MIGPTDGKNWLTVGNDSVPDMDSAGPEHFWTSLSIAQDGILPDLLAFLIQ